MNTSKTLNKGSVSLINAIDTEEDGRFDLILFQDLIDYSNDMVFIINVNTMALEYVNKTVYDQLGYTFAEMKALGVGGFRKSLPEASSFSQHIAELSKTEDGLTDYAILVRKDGSEIYIEANARVIERNNQKYNIATVRDVTENKRLIEKLSYNARQTQDYLDIAKVLIMALDNNQNVVMINQKGADMLGYSKDEIIGKNFIENFLPKSIQTELNEVASDIVEDRAIHEEYVNSVLTKSGVERLISWKNSTLRDKDGKVKGVLSSGEDITEKRQREKQLLIQTKHAQMGEMISMIAHQWRQPLGAISAAAIDLELKIDLKIFDLDAKEGQEAQNAYFINNLKQIGDFVANLSATIDDFRNFYKPNKKLVKTSFQEVTKKARAIIESSFANDKIEFVCDYNSAQEMEMYANEMMQVILNILKNAQDNFKEKQIKNPKITITTDKKSLSVSDNGGGIPPDVLEKIFDPYFSTKDEKNGTGLGLHMSKIIIEEHHQGKLIALNMDGGVRFTISLENAQDKI